MGRNTGSTVRPMRAARLELTGRLSTGFDHAAELQSFANGLRNSTIRLKAVVGNSEVAEGVRLEAHQLLSRTSRLLDQIKGALRDP